MAKPHPKTRVLRAKIRVCAKQLFAERGYSATSVQAIADAAGLSKQALRYHYPTKEALRTDVYAELANEWADFMPQLVGALSADIEASEALESRLLQFVRDDPWIMRCILREMLDPDPRTAETFAAAFMPHMAAAAVSLDDLRNRNVLRHDVDLPAAFAVILHTLLPALALITQPIGMPGYDGMADWSARRLRETFRLLRAGLFVHPEDQTQAGDSVD